MVQRSLGAGVTAPPPVAAPGRRALRGKVSWFDLDAVGMQRPMMQRLVLAKLRFRPLPGFVLVGGVDLKRALADFALPTSDWQSTSFMNVTT